MARTPSTVYKERDRSSSDVVPRSIGRGLDLLEIVLAEKTCNLTTAATTSGLTPTTALRHLRALEARGYVERDDSGRFSAGPTLLRIAASLHDDGPLNRLISVAQPHLERLAAETGESTYLVVSDGDIATYVASAESDRAIRHVGWVGQNVDLVDTAVGDALANPGTCATRTGAVEPDITAISLALPPRGSLGAAVSIIGPEHRLRAKDRKRAQTALEATATNLARDLGDPVVAVAS